MIIYHEFCRLRDLHAPGANAPKHTEAAAFFMAAAQLAMPKGYKLVPLEPTPEIIAGAAVAIWPTASPADIALARLAAPIVLMQMDMAAGTTVDALAGMLATMAPAYRAMLAAAPILSAQAEAAPAPTDSFQVRVQPWLLATFGPEIPADRAERNHRFLEESLELVQSCGCTAREAHQLVDYVFGRPVGERTQEVGGVMVTLAALCLAQGLDMHAAGELELARIWTKVEAIRAKQAAKPKHSPLPQLVKDERAALEDARNAAYPVPDSPHASVNLRAIAERTGFTRGWKTHAALAAAPAQPVAALPNEENTLRYPATMTTALADVLSLPNFRTGPIAHVYRAAGAEIRTKCEDEQAFVLDRFLRLALEHGDDWRTAAEADLKAAHTLAEANKAVQS
ncbi:hypothetical protein [Janthinobacterium sp. RB2R34]|uniref:hypothetical protein n=1 Tax=Janthinobacterium sp. RB2R34 TaxID=3424193 RepID=UPI003F28B444